MLFGNDIVNVWLFMAWKLINHKNINFVLLINHLSMFHALACKSLHTQKETDY